MGNEPLIEEDNTRYIAITKFGNEYYSFVAAGSECYRNYAERAKKWGIEVVAEQFSISDEIINKLDGFDENLLQTGKRPLRDLIDRLNEGKESNPKEALGRLCENL